MLKGSIRVITALTMLSATAALAAGIPMHSYPVITPALSTDGILTDRGGTNNYLEPLSVINAEVYANAPGTSGQYLFNSNGTVIGTAAPGQVNADWNATSGLAAILNKPTIPTNTSQLTNGAGYVPASALGTLAYQSAALYTPTSGLGSMAFQSTGAFIPASAIGVTVQAHSTTLDYLSSGSMISPLKISRNTAALPAAQTGTLLQVGNLDGTTSRYENDSFGASAFFSSIRFDSTAAAPGALQAGEEIGSFNAWGYNGTAVIGPQASFRAYAAQAWSTGATGTFTDVATTTNGTSTLHGDMRFENDGGVTVPNTVTGGDMGAGTLNATGLFQNGAAAAITNIKNAFTVQQNVAGAALTDGATIAWNLDTAQTATVTLAGNRTLANPTNLVNGGSYSLRVVQDGTGGRTLTYGTAFKWPAGTVPTLSTGAGKTDLINCQSDGTSMYCVFAADFR